MSSLLHPSRPKSTRSIAAAVTALLVLAALLIATPAYAAEVVEIEPNSSTATAQPLALGDTMRASFRTSGDCDNNFYDCDTYRVSATSQGRLTLDLRFSDALGTDSALTLSVLDKAGTVTYRHEVSSSDYDGSNLRGLAMFVDSGVSYVQLKTRVSTFSSAPVWKGQAYTLKATVAAMPSETERNATTATADVIALGQKISGSTFNGDCNNNFYDCDFFRVSLPAASRLSVDFRFPCNLGTEDLYRLTIYDTSGGLISETVLKGADCDGATMRAVAASAAAGNAYIRVYSRAGRVTSGQPYNLTVSGVLSSATPTITGSGAVGSTLTANAGTWSPAPVSLKYQWHRNGTAISGATASTYKVAAADAGSTLTVKVTGSKAGYLSATTTSAGKAVPAPISFTDVPREAQFSNEIGWVAARGISTGWVEANGTRTYRPLQPVARDAMAAFLYRLAGSPPYSPPTTSPFSDVPTSNQFYKEISWLAAEKISTGWPGPNGTKTFRPLEPVNRDAMAAFMYRFKDEPAYTPPAVSPFSDVRTDNQFYKQISWLASEEISTGWGEANGSRTYRPLQPVARDAMAAFMYRLIN
ncbi:S-layer homology domain-containing protein [Herbiconiux sp. SYSU D00978]|uniref:S-layer homology domain-containing protein n=1 Tax=Herbiconiux sp. SYSU D00978 TaxID=2812562 RepID=UPI001F601EC3|nr:S-layer homology domain-containing protein [Herbiconiux sp. SYSU D00978]